MLVKIVFRELLRSKVASAFLALMLSVGVAATGASVSMLRPFAFGEAIANAPCSSSLGRLGFHANSGPEDVQEFLLPDQYLFLKRKLTKARVYGLASVSGVPITSNGITGNATVAYVDLGLLNALCAPVAGGAELSSQEGVAVLPGAGPERIGTKSVAVKGRNIPVLTTTTFVGFRKEFEPRAWISYELAERAGIPAEAMHTTIFFEPNAGVSLSGVADEVNDIVRMYPEIFGGLRSVYVVRSLRLSALQLQELKSLCRIAFVATAAFLFLFVANLWLTEKAKRRGGKSTSFVIAALGASRLQTLLYALVEPAILAAFAFPFALYFQHVLGKEFVAILNDPAIERALQGSSTWPILLLQLVLYVAVVGAFRFGYVKSQMRVVESRTGAGGWRPYLLATQSATATFALVLAISATANFYQSTPRHLGYDLRHVRLYEVEGGWLSEHPEFRGGASSGLDLFAEEKGMRVGKSIDPMPLTAYEANDRAKASANNVEVRVVINQIAGDYFGALGMHVSGQGHFSRSGEWSTEDGGPAEVVINRTLSRQLFDRDEAVGATLRLTNFYSKGISKPARVIGVVSEGSTGNANSLSTQRLQPTVYVKQATNLWGVYASYLWVRYLPGSNVEEIDRMAAHAARLMLPGGYLSWGGEAAEAMKMVLGRQRGLAWVVAVGAIGCLVIFALSLVGILAIQAMQQSKRFLTLYAFGLNQSVIARKFAYEAVVPIACGSLLVVATLIPLASLVERAYQVKAALWLISIAVSMLGVMVVSLAAILRQTRAIKSLTFLDLLQQE